MRMAAPENGTVLRRFAGLAWPASLEGLLLVLLSSVDLVMVSGIGLDATSAVGVFSQPKLVLLCAPRSFAVAVTVRTALLAGQGRSEALSRCLKQSLVAGAAGSLILLTAAWIWLESLLQAAGAQPSYLLSAVEYGRPMLLSLFFTAISTVLQGGLLGIGRTRSMLLSNVMGNGANILLNALLIYGLGPFPRMGVAGAGWGTVAGTALTLTMTAASLARGEGYLRGRDGWRPTIAHLGPMAGIFSGALAEQATERVGMFLYSRMAAGLGTMPFAVHTICMNLCDIYYCFAQGLSKAGLSLSSFWLGADERQKFRQLRRLSLRLSGLLGGAAMLLYILIRDSLLGFYQLAPEASLLGRDIMLLVGAVSIPETFSLVCSGLLRGAGQIRYVAVYSLVSIALVRPALTWLLCYGMGLGLYGAWISLMVDQGTRAICAVWKLVLMKQKGNGILKDYD